MATLEQIRDTRPIDAEHLQAWIRQFTGVKVASNHVCRNHHPPLEWLADQWLNRPPLILILGARGSGKSFLQAILTHLESRFHAKLGTRILGGSKDQSRQIYQALSLSIRDGAGKLGSDANTLLKLLTTEATYRNGSLISILAASQTSVRGPHVPSLRLDEVDEIEPDIREAAMGMSMAIGGVSASVSMTSTWHRVGGPMGQLMERAIAGEFPLYTTCTFDVLETCPDERSGPYVGGNSLYRDCGICPLVRWCHSERDRNGDQALAKLANGHYAIDSLIQKVKGVSTRVFESDYLCQGPKAEGIWFREFNEKDNVSDAAEFNPRLKVHCAIDSGVWTGAVWFQVKSTDDGSYAVNCFADYLTEGLSAEVNGRRIIEQSRQQCGDARIRYSTDPAGNSRNEVGPTVVAEYERVGIRPLEQWPHRSVADGLSLVEGLVRAADGTVSLRIHPRCRHLITAMMSYTRAKRAGMYMDWPADPQHPFEDLVDSLRGGLNVEFPDGRRPKPTLHSTPSGHVRY